MKKTTIGNTDLICSRIGLGTWAIGGSEWGGNDEEESLRAIHCSIDQGITLIDTAPIYGEGLAEEIVGRAIAGKRDQVVIATKVGLRWDCEDGEFNFVSGSGKKIYRNLRPKSIREEVDRSLRRLKIDVIDLLQTHWPDGSTPLSDTVGTLVELKEEGKIRALGGCNLSGDLYHQWTEFGPINSIQEMFSMLDRENEETLFAEARTAGASVLAYSPLAMGLLAGKLDPQRVFPSDDIRSWSPRFTSENRQKVLDLLSAFEPFTKKYQVSTAQLVIGWTLSRSAITHVLSGARNPAQAKENAVAGHLEIADSDLAAMNRILTEANLVLPHPFKG
ncbi:MAG: aldo/keto reductase [Puniceicoccaceae bacterium]